MNALLEFNDRHPLATTALGATSGAVSWLLAHTDSITQIASMIGAVCTAVLAAGAVTMKVASGIRRLLRNRAQRRLHSIDTEPPDDFEF